VTVPRYAAIVFLSVAAAVAAALVGLRERLGPGDAVAVVAGASLAAVNSVAAYGLVCWSMGRSNGAFFRAILGGMLVRMTIMLAAVVAGILAFGLPQLPLVFSLLAAFVALLAFELAVISRRLARPAGRVEAT